jgi:hypothetical protein
MCRGLTSSRTASSWPVQSRGGWLVMMAVIRCLRVGGRGPVDVLRWGRRLLALVPAGGVCTVTLIAVMTVTAWLGHSLEVDARPAAVRIDDRAGVIPVFLQDTVLDQPGPPRGGGEPSDNRATAPSSLGQLGERGRLEPVLAGR